MRMVGVHKHTHTLLHLECTWRLGYVCSHTSMSVSTMYDIDDFTTDVENNNLYCGYR
jgi:hypothetical protein